MRATPVSKDPLPMILARVSKRLPNVEFERTALVPAQLGTHAYVVTDSDGKLRRLITNYILDLNLQRGRCLSDRTVQAYVAAAVEFEKWILVRGIEHFELKLTDVGEYRNYLKDEKALANSSVNLHLAGLRRYIEWLVGEGGDQDSPIRRWGGDKQFTRELSMRNVPPMPNVPTLDQFNEILKLVPTNYRLMLLWYQATGLRRSELPRLNLGHIPNRWETQLLKIQIIRKGGYSQEVYVPRELIALTNEYIKFDRQQIAFKLKVSIVDSNSPLFLNKSGRRAKGDSAYRALKAASNKLSIEVKLHSLRHLFAVEIYTRLKKMSLDKADLNALKITQKLLGHRSIETTMEYLRTLPLCEDDMAGVLENLLNDLFT